jgi:citrate lyase subunit beta/citryl-CoA lyase
MIHPPRAPSTLAEPAAAPPGPRLPPLAAAQTDLATHTRAPPGSTRAAVHAAHALADPAARAEGLTAIDGVYHDIADAAGFEAECRQGLEFGFDGKTLIHPSQIDACNTVFAPADEEVSRARAVIAAFALPENAGKGVIKVDGRMTELLHLDEANRVVAVSEAIAAQR